MLVDQGLLLYYSTTTSVCLHSNHNNSRSLITTKKTCQTTTIVNEWLLLFLINSIYIRTKLEIDADRSNPCSPDFSFHFSCSPRGKSRLREWFELLRKWSWNFQIYAGALLYLILLPLRNVKIVFSLPSFCFYYGRARRRSWCQFA